MGKPIIEGNPDGLKIMATLINLLARQEGVKVKYKLFEENEQGEIVRIVECSSNKNWDEYKQI